MLFIDIRQGEVRHFGTLFLLDRYMNAGIYEIEELGILKNAPFNRFGSMAKIVSSFGGKEKYLQAVRQLEELLYEVA